MAFRLRQFAKTGSASSVALSLRRSPADQVVRGWTFPTDGPQAQATTVTANAVVDGHVLINEESFDSWPSGALTAGTSYGSAGWATNPTGAQSGVASPFFPDGKAIQVTTAGYGGVRRAATLPSSGWRVQFFYHASATPTAAAYFARFRIAGTSQMLLRTAAANGIITVRNSAFTNPTSAQSRYQVTAGSKVRVEVQWDPNVGFWVYLYYGDNLFTQEPSETLYHPIEFTPGWAGLAPFDMIELGNDAAGEGYTATFDQVRVLSGAAPVAGPTTLPVRAGLSAAVQTVETGRSQNFNTGTGNVTVGNSGGSNGSAFSFVSPGTGTFTYDATQSAHGGQSLAMSAPNGTYQVVGWSGLNGASAAVSVYMRLATALPTATVDWLRLYGGSGGSTSAIASVYLNSSGALLLLDGYDNVLHTTPNVLAINTWYRVEIFVDGRAGESARQRLAVYVGDSVNPIASFDSGFTVPWRRTLIDDVRLGRVSGSAATWAVNFDSLQVATGVPGFLGPWQSSAAGLSATAGLSADATVTTGGTTHTASASLSATADVVTSGRVVDSGTAALSATAGLTASGTVVDSGSASLSATAGLVVAGTVVDSATASAAAVAGLTVDGYVTRAGSAALSAAAAVTTSGVVVDSTTGALSVSAGLVADGYVVRAASASLAAVAALSSAAGGQTLSATASLTAAAGLSASGVVVDSGTAVLAAAATMSVSGAITDIASATLSATAGLTATGSVTRSSTAALAGTAGMVATGLVTDTADASLSATAGLSASGSVTRVGSAALSATAALAVSAGGTQSATAALAGNAGLTASASVVRPTSSTIGAVGSLAASGFVTRFGSSSLSASAGLAATSSASLSGGGSTSVTASVTATATVTRSGSVTVSATATLVSQGSVSQAGQSSTSVSASIVATASVTATTSASLSGSAGMAVEGSVVVSRIHVWNGTQYKVSTGMYYKTATGWKPIPPSSTYYKTAAGWQSLG